MRKIIILFVILTSTLVQVSGQDLVYPNRPVAMLKSNAGLIIILEYNGGMGVGEESVPFSKRFNSVNVLAGYQINKSFIIAAGTGFSSYNGGTMVPVYLDLRYTFYFSQLAPYLFADGGLLMNLSNLNNTGMFMNPGIGVRYSISRKIAATIAAGIQVQSSGITIDPFINIRTGVAYKF